jgi:hypothetical protein
MQKDTEIKDFNSITDYNNIHLFTSDMVTDEEDNDHSPYISRTKLALTTSAILGAAAFIAAKMFFMSAPLLTIPGFTMLSSAAIVAGLTLLSGLVGGLLSYGAFKLFTSSVSKKISTVNNAYFDHLKNIDLGGVIINDNVHHQFPFGQKQQLGN